MDGINEDEVRAPHMIAAGLINEQPDNELGQRNIDLFHGWNTEEQFYTMTEDTEFLRCCKDFPLRQYVQVRASDIALSPDQQQVMDVLQAQIQTLRNRACPRNLIRRIAVQDKAGSGKSFIIKEILRIATSEFGSDSIRICAPTSIAAIYIGGTTIHSLLEITMANSKLCQLNGESARVFQQSMKDVKFLIVDEMSMVEAKLLSSIEKRCRKGLPRSKLIFGGLFVYFFGDFRQLPPVMDTAIYSGQFKTQLARKGEIVFNSFQKFIELSVSHRQRIGSETFKTLLDRLGSGQFTQKDYDLILTRRTSQLTFQEKESFSTAVKPFSKNADVLRVNKEFLELSNCAVARITSENRPDLATSAKEDIALGLLPTLHLSVGCRVMLGFNLRVHGGLVNGTLGTLTAIVYAEEMRRPSLPLYLLVKFDNYEGPTLRENLFPVVLLTRSWNMRGVQCSRRQVLVSLAHAMTIHKSQGLTLPQISVDLGSSEMALGLTYVALSRVRRLQDIELITYPSWGRFDSIKNCSGFNGRNNFIAARWPQQNH